MDKRLALCKNCGNRIIRLLTSQWIHTDPGWQYFKCPIQEAIDYHPRAEPKEIA
jgi:hypothetical protein